jgi:hypothetical protein
MYILRKTFIAGAALAMLGATVVATSVPASAASGVGRGLANSVAGDWQATSPNTYQAPDDYGSLADFSRSVEGTPCGIACTHDKQMRRGLAY